MPELKIKFDRHGLGDVVHMIHAVQLYKRRGYDVTVQVEENKKFLWKIAGVNIVQGGDLPDHSYHYPAGFDDLNVPDCDANKVAFGLRHDVMPKLEDLGLTREQAWDELCAVRLSAHDHISPEAHAEAEKFLEGMPRPIICFHSRGTNWHERKSIPTDVAFDVILKLLDQTGGSVIVLDFDARAPMVGHERCKGIKPSWGHISVEKLCALYQRSDLMIGVDSGPFHVAALTNVKALGVFRSLHPNRVCLPNPNAVYLVTGHHADQWQRRADRWITDLFAGNEPTADEIAFAAVKVLNGLAPTKESPMLLKDLTGWYEYHRVGHDKRKIELRSDGSIGEEDGKPKECEYQWFARTDNNGDRIAISGKVGIICDCVRVPGETVFRGRWTQFERMPIELIPVAGVESRVAPDRICVVMNWDDDYENIGSVVRANREAYAARHGYQFAKFDFPGSWGKLDAMLSLWDKADWLFWLDADACITDPSHDLQSLLSASADVVVTCDRNGICCGAMLIRTCDAVKAIFEDVRTRREDFDWPNNLWEQNGLMWGFWKIKDRVSVLPQKTMNSYAFFDCPEGSHAWQPGDFVLHCAGLPNEKRIELLRKAAS